MKKLNNNLLNLIHNNKILVKMKINNHYFRKVYYKLHNNQRIQINNQYFHLIHNHNKIHKNYNCQYNKYSNKMIKYQYFIQQDSCIYLK
jgi:hypothetical protein